MSLLNVAPILETLGKRYGLSRAEPGVDNRQWLGDDFPNFQALLDEVKVYMGSRVHTSSMKDIQLELVGPDDASLVNGGVGWYAYVLVPQTDKEYADKLLTHLASLRNRFTTSEDNNKLQAAITTITTIQEFL